MNILPIVAKIARMRIPKSRLKLPKGFKKVSKKQFKEDMQRLGEDIAEGFKEKVTDNIEKNQFGYRLAQSTVVRKGSDTPLIDTHELVDAIYRDKTVVSVEDSPRSDSSLTNKQLAMVQEYGTKDMHIPARPVWRRTFQDYKKEARRKIRDFLETHRFSR